MHRFIFIRAFVLAGAFALAGCDQMTVSPAAALVSGEQGITAIASDGSYVYWSTQKGAVKRISIDGGEPEILVPTGSGALSGTGNLQVDAANVYWTTDASVMAVPKGGGTPVVLAGQTVALSDLSGLTVNDDDDFVYFTESAGFVRKAPKLAGDTVTLAAGEASPTSPVVRGSGLYWVASGLRVLGVEGGTPATIEVNGAPSLFGQISVDDRNAYWASNGVVSWVPLAGGDAAQVTPADATLPEIPVVLGDDSNVYWSDVTGAVSTAAVIPDVNADVVVTGPAGLVTLAIDAANLYWANSADGTVVMMPKAFAVQSSTSSSISTPASPAGDD
jgi:hypothetical protein